MRSVYMHAHMRLLYYNNLMCTTLYAHTCKEAQQLLDCKYMHRVICIAPH